RPGDVPGPAPREGGSRQAVGELPSPGVMAVKKVPKKRQEEAHDATDAEGDRPKAAGGGLRGGERRAGHAARQGGVGGAGGGRGRDSREVWVGLKEPVSHRVSVTGASAGQQASTNVYTALRTTFPSAGHDPLPGPSDRHLG